jgi:hypothetical protein
MKTSRGSWISVEDAPNRLLIGLFLLSLSAAVACDMAGRVAGHVQDRRAVSYEDCSLEVREAETGRVVASRTVSGAFVETVLVSQTGGDYSVSVRCSGAAEAFVSKKIRLGSHETYDNPVDLGTVVLPRQDGSDQ